MPIIVIDFAGAAVVPSPPIVGQLSTIEKGPAFGTKRQRRQLTCGFQKTL